MSEQYIERYWRDATPADSIKEPPMVARFRDEHYKGWVIDKLIYWDRSEVPWNRESGHCYERCQVYDPPDPGEGWRLIDVNKDVPQAGDEMWALGKWEVRSPNLAFGKIFTYRRRIEQPKPEPKYIPFTWEDREELRGRIVTYVGKNRTVEFRCESFAVDDDGLLVNDTYAAWLCKNAVFVDTKEPVGRKVTL